MTRQHKFVSALALSLMWLLAMPVQAAVEAGRILFARGTVSIVGENESARGARAGSVFHEGERVVTGNNSIVQLRMSDGALTALRSNSDYHIQRQRYDEVAGVYEQAGRVVTGWMRSVTGAIGARYPGNVSQGTSVATIGIRGTTYQIIHVPPQGLPEFPNLQPGSYIYLEDGQIEVSNEAGSRIVSPGQVVRISGPDITPELAPEMEELFQTQLLASLGSSDTEGFEVRDLLENANDQIVDNTDAPAPELGGNIYALTSCSLCYGLVELSNDEQHSDIGGSGRGRFLSSVDYNSGDATLSGLPDKSPIDTGYYALYDNGELISQVHWGRWRESTYTLDDEISENGDWPYIFADNVLPYYEGVGLTGSWRYSLSNRGIFRGVDAEGNAISSRLLNNSYVNIFFDDFIEAKASLYFSDGNTLTGRGSLVSLYAEELGLSGDNEGVALYGSMNGALLGSNASGLMAMISLTAEDPVNQEFLYFYSGGAVFQRSNELQLLGGVTAFGLGDGQSTSYDAIKGVLNPRYVQMGIGNGYLYPTHATLTVNGSPYEYELALNEMPGNMPTDVVVLDDNGGVAARVFWGMWESYDVMSWEQSDYPEAGGWHYMVSTDVLSESAVSAIGLTGQHTYFHAGGTPLVDVSGIDPSGGVIGSSSTVVVDFGNLMLDVSLDVTTGSYIGEIRGAGSLSDLYSAAGIGLSDVGDPFVAGSLSGTFAGAAAEALLGAVNVTYNGESYIGTALFQQEQPHVVAP